MRHLNISGPREPGCKGGFRQWEDPLRGWRVRVRSNNPGPTDRRSNLTRSGFDPFRRPHQNCLAYEESDTERVSNMPVTSTTRLPLLTIRGVRTSAVEVPMKFPLGTSAGTVHSAPLLSLVHLREAESKKYSHIVK